MLKTPITIERLRAAGWKINTGEDAMFSIMEKELSEPVTDPEAELQSLALEINRDHNQEQFSLRLCEGAKLDLSFEYMEEIEVFEKVVLGYRPRW